MNFWVIFAACCAAQAIYAIIGFVIGFANGRNEKREIEKRNKELEEYVSKIGIEMDARNEFLNGFVERQREKQSMSHEDR